MDIEDLIKDITKDIEVDGVTKTLSLHTEYKFSHQLYEKACIGFEDDPPPDPNTFCFHGDMLRNNWEMKKVEIIGIIEDPKTSQEHREAAEAFLKCHTALYLDYMSCFTLTWNEEIKEQIKELELL